MTKIEQVFVLIIFISFTSGNPPKKPVCTFKYDRHQKYTCEMSNLNISQKGESIDIFGNHLQQHKNTDVKQFLIGRGQLMRFIPQEIFREFVNLEVIVINHVLLHDIDNGTFFNCRLLEDLDLSNNIIEYIPNGVFNNCNKIKSIKLTDNYLDQLIENTFRFLNFLKVLNFEKNLFGLEDPMKATINSQTLLELDLSNNEIVDLSENLIQKVRKLTNLKLSYNHISAIPKDFFSTSENLLELSLDRNRLSLLFADAFKYLRNLEKLDLAYNIISYVHCDVFTNMTNLKELKLDGNLIYAVCAYAFIPLGKLTSLEISINHIGNLGYDPLIPLESLKQLESLDFSHNRLEFMDENFGLRENIQLVELLLNNNRIYFIHSKMFEKFLNLKLLDLSYNCLIILSDDTFKYNQNLASLNFASNNFTRLEFEFLCYMTSLEVLNFSMNMITEINPQLPSFFMNKNVNLIGNDCFSGTISIPTGRNVSEITILLSKCLQNYEARNPEDILMPTTPPRNHPVLNRAHLTVGNFVIIIFLLIGVTFLRAYNLKIKIEWV